MPAEVPADAFYEWKVIAGSKQPYAIAREDGQPMAFAGLWESFRWPDETVTRSFTILTTPPNAEMAALHDRMPVILEQLDWPVWLGAAEAEYAALLRAAPDGLLCAWLVDRRFRLTPQQRAGAAGEHRWLDRAARIIGRV
jgi:putative SOS response-associated peptidase YedK